MRKKVYAENGRVTDGWDSEDPVDAELIEAVHKRNVRGSTASDLVQALRWKGGESDSPSRWRSDGSLSAVSELIGMLLNDKIARDRSQPVFHEFDPD